MSFAIRFCSSDAGSGIDRYDLTTTDSILRMARHLVSLGVDVDLHVERDAGHVWRRFTTRGETVAWAGEHWPGPPPPRGANQRGTTRIASLTLRGPPGSDG